MIQPARILITAGEPAGIGPEIIVKLAQEPCSDQLIACASPTLLKDTAQQLHLPLELSVFNTNEEALAHRIGHLWIVPVELESPVIAGKLNQTNAAYVIKTLDTAHQLAINGAVNAILTGPVHKGIINQSGLAFTGHTEFFADKSNAHKVVMMLATEGLRVALATTHLPLKEVSGAVTPQLLQEVIEILIHELQSKFSLKRPKVLVCGLNPHAGEDGHLGREEVDTIIPTLEKMRTQFDAELIGPIPADTAFQPKWLTQVDTVLAMYHDQGLPTLKYKGFGKAINLTLGLPYIRTSVDHGTGLDIAGQGLADIGSMHYALQFTQQLINNRKSN
ncbi:4-hydroxythreonine-4-phosphate dehydrogenase PdxA [Kangiella koreensis]|uniref:4-hydroxythreonine-4-phosphate dehydrogenase n=1 Tax=Kangiella koreensis (strain DSM 16069 / JCM 12317 / KCTC 12182 / SW-125) TaxID=523791 RepID=C7R7U0_KANKD|nr:4-hydroxythreonine-4-phosphate dehydrogenase PdxA [Kangiella koreensis]ACV27623.1 4-hydroxythreonine-4-phosphate dehydrogenase [Kangiella koreensis DSM 16069]